eukprot:CAMPEP_0197855968 /NCGR_PEP_ID=MMETSP1438-20131217/27605_1 /TAXON_ID=1461541 /ORGANISM="Pterosperma sp., Strain CCMP1384" /LENGTH=887 /DNA_ID=CAMNT_0043471247 /DNA_START=250 /DNA_END=2913 /DNA_ORIENTATION=+
MTATEMATEEAPKEVFRRDYKPYEYVVKNLDLDFQLGEEKTLVTSTLKLAPNTSSDVPPPLVLDGAPAVVLKSVSINGTALSADVYEHSSKQLVITSPPSGEYTLEVVTEIEPQNNTSLEGLYKSSGNFCTQCEAEGFRSITFFPDRPDVLTVYTTTITADKEKYPVLLGNGNLIKSGDAEGGKHFTVWEDPFKKPCYLFALVAGNLANIEDSFVTASGRKVTLRIFTEKHNIDKCEHAMTSLKASMKWDEEVFGLEYDLDLFNIVAVDDFNMGAMENKSLNIFNSRLVLASPATATDADYSAIEGVVAHEYFHNWTGNRVTCQDWFQLSLKEGLTVFRDQQFSADMNNRGVKRIGDVSRLRNAQFAEDASPMAHPVRPDSYIKMDNFYTTTVYEKGAEVVRMYHTLLGVEGFRKGMDLYFKRHDGGAVTCDDFRAAMFEANNINFPTFDRWYSQAGTPDLHVDGSYDAAAKTYTLSCKQNIPATPGQDSKEPALIPIAVGLLGSDGKDLPLTLNGNACGTTAVLQLDQSEASFVFEGVAEPPSAASILRNFSAPVKLTTNQTEDELMFLLANDSDEFNRWEAGQSLGRKLLLQLVKDQQEGKTLTMDPRYIEAMKEVLTNSALDRSFVAAVIALPSESELADFMKVADPDAVHIAREFVIGSIAKSLRSVLEGVVSACSDSGPFSTAPGARANRTLKNSCLKILGSLNDPTLVQDALSRYHAADNMTDQLGALASINGFDSAERTGILEEFYQKWKEDPLVLNKWLSIQAQSSMAGNVKNVEALMSHPAFALSNPNKVYSLLGGFCMGSPVNFHNKDGSGYKLLGDAVIQLDKLNPQVAARMVKMMSRWKQYDSERQGLIKAQLKAILDTKNLSENTYEIVSKSLE